MKEIVTVYFQQSFSFYIQLLIGVFPFLLGLPRRKYFWARVPLAVLFYLATTITIRGFFLLFFDNGSTVVDTINACVFFSMLVVLFAVQIRIPNDISFYKAFFLSVGGYSIEHISEAVAQLVFLCLNAAGIRAAHPMTIRIGIGILIAAAFYYGLIRKAMQEDFIQYREKRVWTVSVINLFVCIVLSVLTDSSNGSEMSKLVCRLYAVVSCSLCLLLQAGFFREEKLSAEKDQLQRVLDISREQQRISRETIDYINIKCHDLKYQIRRIGKDTDSDSIRKLSDAVMIYDSILKTGNETLDLVIMEKKLLCERKEIEFKIVADGKLLSFMDDSDLYALFGNMLDNAIESSSKNPAAENRCILLEIFARGSILYIHEENDCTELPQISNGFPKTTKADPMSHGFGVRSMDYLVKQYGGELMFNTERNRFHVEILIPLP